MSSDIDYDAVTVSAEKAPKEYTYVERRGELLQLIIEAGHPRAVNQTELAERYGVSQQQISKDMDRLSEYVAEYVGENHLFIMESIFQGAMLNLVNEGDYYRAAQVARWWSEWIDDIGAIPVPEKSPDPAGQPIESDFSEEDMAMIDYITNSAGPDSTLVE